MTPPRFSKIKWCALLVVWALEAADLSQAWTYVVEMELGPEPDMGRVGSETMIPTPEADIHEVNN